MEAEELLVRAWKELGRAVVHRKHPFHTCTLATAADGIPQARIVVLRHASDGMVGCHADVRSPKAIQSGGSVASWLFYSFPDKLQIRVTGPTVVHHLDDIAREAWEKSQLLSRRCYLAPHAPGALLDAPDGNMPPGLEDREPTEEESVPGFENFGVIRTTVSEIEVLSLEFTGARRCRFGADGQSQWLAP